MSYGLTDGAENHELPASKFLDGEYGDERSGEVFSTVECGEKTTCEPTEADAVLENRGGVVLRR